jgi:hypothetical protein
MLIFRDAVGCLFAKPAGGGSRLRFCSLTRKCRAKALQKLGGAPGDGAAGRPKVWISQPVSRVLDGMQAPPACVTTIPLGRRSPGASSDLPGRWGQTLGLEVRRLRVKPRAVPIRSCSRWGLPCRRRCRRRGALLPHLFTLTAVNATRRGGMFSVALSLGSRPPDVIRHRLSMEPGLSSPATFRFLPERPSDRLTCAGMGASAPAVKRPTGRNRGRARRWCAPGRAGR